MTRLTSLPEDASLIDLFRAYPDPLLRLNDFTQALMRGPSPLSEAQRELIAAFVSGLNGCRYCFGVHAETARTFGVDKDLLENLLNDLDAAPVEDRMKPLLAYVKKLTHAPSRMTDADADAVRAAGWDDTALLHAVTVGAYFNMMNRLVDGAGVKADPEYHRLSGRRLAEHGYGAVKDIAESGADPRTAYTTPAND